jgi:glutaminyl-peptide cyclotransferase
LESHNYTVELRSFKQDTIVGVYNFTNIIAKHKLSRNPPLPKKKVLITAHFDSKLFSNFLFLGATDSVVPCAMMLEFAKFIDQSNNEEMKMDIEFGKLFQ